MDAGDDTDTDFDFNPSSPHPSDEGECAPYDHTSAMALLMSEEDSQEASPPPRRFTLDLEDCPRSHEARHGSALDPEADVCPIGKRTRAHLSLADMSLDELEAILEHSDEEDFFQNLDEDVEYQKFLSSFLADVDPPAQLPAGNADVAAAVEDDDDEDDDEDWEVHEGAGFEAENLSDSGDELLLGEGTGVRPPRTRSKSRTGPGLAPSPNPRKKYATRKKKAPAGPSKLRPLLPLTAPVDPPNLTAPAVVIMTEGQVARLRVQILEHSQLLLQVHAMAAYQRSGGDDDVAAQLEGLIADLARSAEVAPGARLGSAPVGEAHFCSVCGERGCESGDRWRHGVGWCGAVDGLVLRRAEGYLEMVRKRRKVISDGPIPVQVDRWTSMTAVHSTSDPVPSPNLPSASSAAQEPSSCLPPTAGDCSEGSLQANPQSQEGSEQLPGEVPVPSKKEPGIVPHFVVNEFWKFVDVLRPCLAVRSLGGDGSRRRAMFTESEDRLLAMGVEMFNSDWEAIQRRFLPAKTAKQIFIRHKNFMAARTADNPIKEIRRRKLAPLTDMEKLLLNQGLKLERLPFEEACRKYLPHRDPLQVPRLWKSAFGLPNRRAPRRQRGRQLAPVGFQEASCSAPAAPSPLLLPPGAVVDRLELAPPAGRQLIQNHILNWNAFRPPNFQPMGYGSLAPAPLSGTPGAPPELPPVPCHQPQKPSSKPGKRARPFRPIVKDLPPVILPNGQVVRLSHPKSDSCFCRPPAQHAEVSSDGFQRETCSEGEAGGEERMGSNPDGDIEVVESGMPLFGSGIFANAISADAGNPIGGFDYEEID